jgi:hypothetical protein
LIEYAASFAAASSLVIGDRIRRARGAIGKWRIWGKLKEGVEERESWRKGGVGIRKKLDD